ncbi:MAG TPA: transcriptional regulator [Acidobacteriaceae bacterium]
MLTAQLHTELWTSWASLLRSYAAAHGLNSTQHAVVEVSATEITLRVGSRWLRFTPNEVTASNQPPLPFHLNENGTATIGNKAEQEMDLAAEHFAREIMDLPQ